jgi:hypothetical protein
MNVQHNQISDLSGSETIDFLTSILPTEGIYYVGTRVVGGGFINTPCTTIPQVAEKALDSDRNRCDAYFACASYSRRSYKGEDGKEHTRTRDNARLVKSLWCEIDCGELKAESGQGYITAGEAGSALKAFCQATGLPIPTIVRSGGGLHCYWVFTQDVTKEAWLPIARNFKQLTREGEVKLLADPSRTADIASVLRPVGTHNWKPERNGAGVRLFHSMKPMEFADFSNRINTAHAAMLASRPVRKLEVPSVREGQALSLEQVAEALRYVDPDVGRNEWWSILAAAADAYGEAARSLLKDWSAGELHDKRASLYDEADFDHQYSDLLGRKDYDGPRATMGTVIKIARDHGWVGPSRNGAALPNWVSETNDEYAWIEAEASVYRLKRGDFIDPAKLRLQLDNQTVEIETPSGSRRAGKGSAWLKHPLRRQHDRLVLAPGESRVTKDNCLNEWMGFAVKPVAGDVQPFVDLLARLVPEDQARAYLLAWLAHLIQHPGTKMHVSPVLWSTEEGVGKNLLLECISSIIGPTHSVVIGQSELSSDFNTWAARKIFVIGDEVSSSDRRQDRDKLKGLITGRDLHINAKHQPLRMTPNLLNFVFLSNHNDALFLGDTDRRYFVLEIKAPRLPEPEIDRFVTWRDTSGLGALLHYLLTVNTKSFKPKAPAPMSDAKLQMIQDNRSDLETWMSDLMSSDVAALLGREIVAASEVASRYSIETGHRKPSSKTVVGIARRFGAWIRPSQVKLPNGKKVRVMAIANPKHWAALSDVEWAEELTKRIKFG